MGELGKGFIKAVITGQIDEAARGKDDYGANHQRDK